MTRARWLLVLAAALLLVGLMTYARGEKHHHGDDVGAFTSIVVS